jgi:hypothetical protein
MNSLNEAYRSKALRVEILNTFCKESDIDSIILLIKNSLGINSRAYFLGIYLSQMGFCPFRDKLFTSVLAK